MTRTAVDKLITAFLCKKPMTVGKLSSNIFGGVSTLKLYESIEIAKVTKDGTLRVVCKAPVKEALSVYNLLPGVVVESNGKSLTLNSKPWTGKEITVGKVTKELVYEAAVKSTLHRLIREEIKKAKV